MTGLNFKNKEEYLAYRAEWKAAYKKLSKDSREAKNKRKKFTWEYRPSFKEVGVAYNNSVKRKTKIGRNPNYDMHIGGTIYELKHEAVAMLERLAEAKIKAGKQMKVRLEDEKQAA